MRVPIGLFIIMGALMSSTASSASEEDCKGGCAAATHEHKALKPEELRAWLEAYAEDPVDAEEIALETLLFHSGQVKAHIEAHGPAPLPKAHARFLMRELEKTHALLEVRLVDKKGQVLAAMPPTVVLLGKKEHLTVPGNAEIQAFDYSGTIKRVGLKHLWGRL